MDEFSRKYISDCYIELFDSVGPTLTYVPHDPLLTKPNAQGKLIVVYDSSKTQRLKGSFEIKDFVDSDAGNVNKLRQDASIRLVTHELLSLGINVKVRDAFDVTSIFGVTTRYVVTGFDNEDNMAEIIFTVLVTEEAKAFK